MTCSNIKVGIVGAGIMGRLLAWQLVNQGHSITLFDKDPIEQGNAAAYTAAGMLTPYSEIESAELLVFQLGMHSLSLWPEIIRGFSSDVGFKQLGSLIVSHPDDKPDFIRFNQQLKYKLSSKDRLNLALHPKIIQQPELSALEPELAVNFSQATYLPQEAWLCTRCVMKTLAGLLLAKRVHWYAHTEISELGAHYVKVKRHQHNFDWVIDCRGLGAKPDLTQLRGVRGELVLLQAPEVKINRLIRLMHPRYRLYVVPKYKDDLYIVGATQIESDDSSPISVRSALELLSASYSLHSGFAEARLLESKTSCRPAFSDNLPRIQVSDGLIRVNGLFRHGFLLAPALAEQVAEFLSGKNTQSSDFPMLFHSIDKEGNTLESTIC